VPAILEQVGDGTFYRTAENSYQRLIYAKDYAQLVRPPNVVRLGDVTRGRKPVIKNKSASLWDIDDGVACVEFHSKANALDPDSMAILGQALEIVQRDFVALLIHNEAPQFSVGFNLDFALAAAREKAWSRLDAALDAFQSACMASKYAPFPVVGAPSGLGLGGGFEVLLHCNALVAHANCNVGLVEPMVGLVPSGGGCKEMLHRWTVDAKNDTDYLQGAIKVFEIIGMCRTATSPIAARPLKMLLDRDRYCMNRDSLLAEGKARALELAENYAPPAQAQFRALGATGRQPMHEMLDRLEAKGIAMPHDLVVSRQLARVLCGGDRSMGEAMSEDDVLDLEREAFITLCDTSATVDRIAHMLTRGRPLRN
jgi:3-hydroxyacyl-CoA dehydrogenase